MSDWEDLVGSDDEGSPAQAPAPAAAGLDWEDEFADEDVVDAEKEKQRKLEEAARAKGGKAAINPESNKHKAKARARAEEAEREKQARQAAMRQAEAEAVERLGGAALQEEREVRSALAMAEDTFAADSDEEEGDVAQTLQQQVEAMRVRQGEWEQLGELLAAKARESASRLTPMTFVLSLVRATCQDAGFRLEQVRELEAVVSAQANTKIQQQKAKDKRKGNRGKKAKGRAGVRVGRTDEVIAAGRAEAGGGGGEYDDFM